MSESQRTIFLTLDTPYRSFVMHVILRRTKKTEKRELKRRGK
jgi:hypothetical protein